MEYMYIYASLKLKSNKMLLLWRYFFQKNTSYMMKLACV